MALTESTMLPLGATAPDFSLPDVRTGRLVSLDDVARDKGVLVIFLCAHCPYVVHIQQELGRLSREYADKPIGIVGISANSVQTHPRDAPPNLAKQAEDYGFAFPYLYDETQETAKAYRAACTPDFFLFDGDRKLAYRGQFDASRPGNDVPVTGADLRAALDALLEGRAVSPDQRPSIGCNIKWTPGNEPAYAR